MLQEFSRLVQISRNVHGMWIILSDLWVIVIHILRKMPGVFRRINDILVFMGRVFVCTLGYPSFFFSFNLLLWLIIYFSYIFFSVLSFVHLSVYVFDYSLNDLFALFNSLVLLIFAMYIFAYLSFSLFIHLFICLSFSVNLRVCPILCVVCLSVYSFKINQLI